MLATMKKIASASAKIPVRDDWVVMAMTDDAMVAELLLRLKHTGTVVADHSAVNLPPLRWGIRKRRSQPSRFGGGGVIVSMKKDVDSVRASPKTPLSWSGGSGNRGGSASPSADGFEEDDTTRHASCSTSTGSGSKVFPTNEITSSFPKRLKKKKSSSELKNEENLKLKERLYLEKEIASLRATLDEQYVRNQRLKRIKLDMNPDRVKNETRVDLIQKSQPVSKSGRSEGKNGDSENAGSIFFLPDLNVVPSEDEMLYENS